MVLSWYCGVWTADISFLLSTSAIGIGFCVVSGDDVHKASLRLLLKLQASPAVLNLLVRCLPPISFGELSVRHLPLCQTMVGYQPPLMVSANGTFCCTMRDFKNNIFLI